MISRSLAALALGGSLFIILPDSFQAGKASQYATVSPDLIQPTRKTLATDRDNLTIPSLRLDDLISAEGYWVG